MTFLNRICTICLFIFLTCNVDSKHRYKWRTKELGNYPNIMLDYYPLSTRLVEPLSYIIILKMPSVENNVIFSGYNVALIIIENPTFQLNLNVYGLKIKKVKVRLYRYPYQNKFKLRKLSYLNDTETVLMDFETKVPSGYYKMYMQFIGNLSESETGLYRTTCKDCNAASRWIFVAQLKPIAARSVFPCWDEPIWRTKFAIGIRYHRNYTSLSNMRIQSQQTINDTRWTRFHTTPPIPPYLVAFSIMDFVCSTIKTYHFTTHVCSTPLVKQERMSYALNTSANVIAYLMWYMRISPQFPEITHIALPNFSYEAAGNWGFNIYRKNHLIYHETLHPIDRKLDVSMYVSSTVALQWVGNLVSPTSWTHMWFNQALALFYGVKAFTKTYDDEDIKYLFIYRLQSLAREDNSVFQVKPVMYPADTRDEIDTLIKSSHFTNCLKEYAIIAMLEHVITESIFEKVIILYLKKYQFSTATPNDFWDILQYVIKERKILHIHPPIAQIVQTWLQQRSLPVITVTRKHINDYVKIIIRPPYGITKENDTENIDNTDKLWIPVNYITKSSPKDIPDVIWFSPGTELFSFRDYNISDLGWVIVNWQHTGYYRVKYDALSLDILDICLKSEERTKIHVLNRAHIIEDAYYFWTEEKLQIRKFLHLIRFMSTEEHCAPWYALQNTIQKMGPFLDIVDYNAPISFQRIVRFILDQLLQKVGYTEHPGETECVKFKRLLATKWSCHLRHRECLQMAQKRLIEHLSDPEKHIILPIWEEWTYCNGISISNRSIWNMVWKEYKETSNKKILTYLACSENRTIIRHYLELTMWRYPILYDAVHLSSKDLQLMFYSIIKNHISKDEVLGYALEKIMGIENEKEFIEHLSYIIKYVCSKAQMKKISSLIQTGKGIHHTLQLKLLPKIEDQLSRITKWERISN